MTTRTANRCRRDGSVSSDPVTPTASFVRLVLTLHLSVCQNPGGTHCHSFIYSFTHSFRLCLWRLFKSTTTQRRSRQSTDILSEFHAEAPQATTSDGLAQGPYVAAKAGFEPATLWTKGVESTNEPPRPTH